MQVRHIRDASGKITVTLATIAAIQSDVRIFGSDIEKEAVRVLGGRDGIMLRGIGCAVRSERDVENRRKAVEIAVGRAHAAIERQHQPISNVLLETRGHTTVLRTPLSWRVVAHDAFFDEVVGEIQGVDSTIAGDGCLLRLHALYTANLMSATGARPFSAETRDSFDVAVRMYNYVTDKLALQTKYGVGKERGR